MRKTRQQSILQGIDPISWRTHQILNELKPCFVGVKPGQTLRIPDTNQKRMTETYSLQYHEAHPITGIQKVATVTGLLKNTQLLFYNWKKNEIHFTWGHKWVYIGKSPFPRNKVTLHMDRYIPMYKHLLSSRTNWSVLSLLSRIVNWGFWRSTSRALNASPSKKRDLQLRHSTRITIHWGWS